MVNTEIKQASAQLVETCQLVFNGNYTPGKSGNISVKINNDSLLVTPSGWSLMDVQSDHVVQVTHEKSIALSSAFSHLKPSSELPVHQAIYQTRPDIGAVIHAHPVKATSFAVAGIALDQPIIPELTASLGNVPLVPYELPGSEAFANIVSEAFKDAQAVLLANHGVITTGKTLKDAYFNLQLLESYAEIMLNCRQLGNVNVLNETQVKDIHTLVEKMQAGLVQ